MRCYNQKCINKSENAANRATKSSNTGRGPARRKDSQRFVCKEKLSSQRGEERSDVVEVWAVMFHSGGLGRQMRRIVKSSQSFQCRGKMEDETAEHRKSATH